MKLAGRLRLFLASLTTLGAMLMTTACDAGPEIVDHSFEFNALEDSPGVRILDHRYGDSDLPGARNPDYRIKEDRPLQRAGITGAMKRPDSLYVRWLVLDDNRIYEDTVDLRKRLPKDLDGRKVYFLVRGPQLYVYLISREPRPKDIPPSGPEKYRDSKVVTIYPDKKR